MTDREQAIERLMAFPYGLDRAEAERRVRDDDLWLVEPELRCGAEGEEAVEQWREAVGFADALAEGFSSTAAADGATLQLLWDMRWRAEEALRRALRRAASSA